MGIPKFYRWISERYPCLSEKIREYQIPDFDNLYLDMNGIIHTCSHPNDDDVHLRIPEEAVFKEIFRYIDFLFKMIKPRKVFFMAIDGVAPRAKMNQQRGRRFRSAKLALDQEAEAIKKGEKLPSEERFDSNCITPGTEFMARLHEHLQYFVKVKVSTDPLWQREGLVVILSGHDVPGEGEHKIMDYIRHIRSQPNYDAETRHCLYGLDADLIMLGLSTHELHFSLLREEVKFGPIRKRRRPQQPPLQNSEKKAFDPNTVSVFKATEPGAEGDAINGDEVALAASDNVATQSLSYAGAAKLESIKQEPVPKSESVNVDKQLLPPSSDVERKKKDTYHPPLPEKTTFLLLHLSLLRDYLDEEFSELKERLKDTSLEYNLENVIDDWILMCILVGNDFVPNLPHLHITTNALPMIYGRYMNVLPTLGGYLNENGILNLERFESFLKEISVFDVENFRATYDDMKYMAAKTGKNIVLGDEMMQAFEFDDADGFKEEALEVQVEVPRPSGLSELDALINRTQEEVFGPPEDDSCSDGKQGETSREAFPANDDIFEDDDSPELRLEFAQSKRHYYMTKMNFKEVQKEVQQLAIEYIRAVQWVLLYYYKGVSSWCWYYPAHYAPFSSDLVNFKDAQISFDKGQPFRPFEQLLGVLPSQSKKLLPACYQWLMTHSGSPIISFYPEKFEQDLNGKKQDWEAVILIPFIDEVQLLKAMETEESKLSTDEAFRNSRGKMLVYSYSSDDTGPIVAPGNKFPVLPESHFNLLGLDDVLYDPVLLPKGIHPGAKRDTIYQGFPTIKSIPHKSYLMEAQVKVFDMQARDVSMVLDLTFEDENARDRKKLVVEDVAKSLLGKTVWVNWPHLTPALVTGVSDATVKYVDYSNGSLVIDPKHSAQEQNKVVEGLEKRHMSCKAIKLGDVEIVFYAKLMDGRKVRCDKSGRVIVDNLWQKIEQPFAYQTTITNDDSIAVFSITGGAVNKFKDLYRLGDTVFLLDRELLGAKAIVKDHDVKRSKVNLEYSMPVYKNINSEALKDMYYVLRKWNDNNYFSTYEAARMCNLDAYTFSKISGSIFVTVEKGQSPKKKSKGFSKRKQRGKTDGKSDDEKSSSEEDIHLAQETKKVNVGLDLKFNKRNQKARGYTTKDPGDRGKWAYSSKTVKLVKEYVQQFPDFVRYLSSMSTNVRNIDTYMAADIFPDDPIGRIREMQDWVDGLGLRYSVQRIDLSSDILDDDEIQIIWNHILHCKVNAQPDILKPKTVTPNMIYKPGLNRGSVLPIYGQSFHILDRVVCVDQSASMPLGQRGTVVGIQEPQVREHNDAIEESFKATNATMLLTLIILTDPQPDVFDKVADGNHGSSSTDKKSLGDSPNGVVKKDMTLALNQFLGLTSSKDDKILEVEKPEKASASISDDVYKPLPRLVKLFPYQVINITEGEVESYVSVSENVKCGEYAKKPSGQLHYKNNATNNINNTKKIPSLLSDFNSPFCPSKSKTVVVPGKGSGIKYPNFVKASDPSNFSREANEKVKNSKADANPNAGGFGMPLGPDLVPKKNKNAPNNSKSQVKQQPSALDALFSGKTPSISGSNSTDKNFGSNPDRPIVILKRPTAGNSQKSENEKSLKGNPIFSLLESSLEQQRASQHTKNPGSVNKETQKKTKSDNNESSKGQSSGRKDKKQQDQRKAAPPSTNEQKLPQQNLLNLLQNKQTPASSTPQQVTQRLSLHPFPQNASQVPFPLPPPLLPQRYIPPFSTQQQQNVHQQYVQHQQMIHSMMRQQHHVMDRTGQILMPNVQPILLPSGMQPHPSGVQKSDGLQHSNSKPNASKTTTSFVPTQVLSGGSRGGPSFPNRSKKQYSTHVANNGSNVASVDVKGGEGAQAKKSGEIPIEELLLEATKKLNLATSSNTKPPEESNPTVAGNKTQDTSGVDLLSQLATNLRNFGNQQPTATGGDEKDDKNSRKPPRLAANFNFGP